MASFGDIKSVEAFKLEEIKKELTNLLNAELANWKTKNPGVAEEDLQCLKMLG